MPQSLPTAEFLELARTRPVIDVRSPAEFAHAHVPGAVSIPLFDNEERARVGTTYKQIGRDEAVLQGLDVVGPKLAGFVRQVRELAAYGDDMLVHCWRGGMRSGSFAWLLETSGFRVATLQGGYKAYRQEVLQAFEQPQNIVILGGKTGSAKTDVLAQLQQRGEQVIDLEALANHKGSSYGRIGQLPQPTSEQFENLLYQQWTQLDPTRRVWIEDESRSVGVCFVPPGLWQQMRTAPVVFLDVDLEQRVDYLVDTYGQFPHEELLEATDRLKKRLGNDRHQLAMQAIERRDYAEVTRITLQYYDKAYLFGLAQRDSVQVHKIEVPGIDPAQNAETLIKWAESKFNE